MKHLRADFDMPVDSNRHQKSTVLFMPFSMLNCVWSITAHLSLPKGGLKLHVPFPSCSSQLSIREPGRARHRLPYPGNVVQENDVKGSTGLRLGKSS